MKDTAEHTAQAAAEEQEMSWNGRKEGHMHALSPSRRHATQQAALCLAGQGAHCGDMLLRLVTRMLTSF